MTALLASIEAALSQTKATMDSALLALQVAASEIAALRAENARLASDLMVVRERLTRAERPKAEA